MMVVFVVGIEFDFHLLISDLKFITRYPSQHYACCLSSGVG